MLAGGLWSCHPKASQELTALDSLRQVVRDTEELLNSVDTGELKQMKEIMAEDMAFLRAHFNDSSDREFYATTMSDYYRFNKNTGKFFAQEADWRKEIQYCYTQLSDLRRDLNGRVLDRKTFAEYYASEANAVQRLQSSVGSGVAGVQAFIPRFQELYDEVHLRIDSIKEGMTQ
jgi:hypothetical protein